MDMDEEKSRGTDSQENTVNDSSGDITYHYTRPQYGQYRFHEEQQGESYVRRQRQEASTF